jgi:hypothetical protein
VSLTFNEAAESLLSESGFSCEPEPDWVKGKVPDFFCTGRAQMWVEVKSLDDPKELAVPADALRWFQKYAHRVQNTGSALAFVADDVSQRDLKVALAIADDALAEMHERAREATRTCAIIPSDPDYGEHVRISAPVRDGVEIFQCCKSINGKYGRPLGGGRLVSQGRATVTEMDGSSYELSVGELGLFKDDFLVGLDLTLSNKPFEVTGVMRTGGAIWLPNVRKFRKSADRANMQFVNACKHREASCFLMLFQNDVLVSDDLAFISAFYGDLQATWTVGSVSKDTTLSFGPNGFWGPEKNRTTSAACYVRNRETPIMVHNFWAKNRIVPKLLGCIEYVPFEDGTFKKVEPEALPET